MKENFGILPNGTAASLYTIASEGLKATVSDFGATLVSLFVPDKNGVMEDVVLGYDDANGYAEGTIFLGATVGRSGNRIAGASFELGGKTYTIPANEGENNLHSGPDFYHARMWTVEEVDEKHIRLGLDSPDGDQGYPGNAHISVTYAVEGSVLKICFDGKCDQDTIFNMTNHSYFNLAGQDKTDKALDQVLMIPAEQFCVADAASIPTGETRNVEGTPMDFRTPKAIRQDLDADYEPLKLQAGYDHNFCAGSATLCDPASGRVMNLTSTSVGVQFYCGNFVSGTGKKGMVMPKRSAICLEPQFYPDAIHRPEWVQPVTKAGEAYHAEIAYAFSIAE